MQQQNLYQRWVAADLAPFWCWFTHCRCGDLSGAMIQIPPLDWPPEWDPHGHSRPLACSHSGGSLSMPCSHCLFLALPFLLSFSVNNGTGTSQNLRDRHFKFFFALLSFVPQITLLDPLKYIVLIKYSAPTTYQIRLPPSALPLPLLLFHSSSFSAVWSVSHGLERWPAIKPDALSLFPGTQIVGEKRLAQVLSWPPHMHCGTRGCPHTINKMEWNKISQHLQDKQYLSPSTPVFTRLYLFLFS